MYSAFGTVVCVLLIAFYRFCLVCPTLYRPSNGLRSMGASIRCWVLAAWWVGHQPCDAALINYRCNGLSANMVLVNQESEFVAVHFIYNCTQLSGSH